MEQLEINTNHPEFCHVRCCMKPSMKAGIYRVYILLRQEGDIGYVSVATCECAAGLVINSMLPWQPLYVPHFSVKWLIVIV